MIIQHQGLRRLRSQLRHISQVPLCQRRHSSRFNVVEHTVKGQHSRQYAAGTLGPSDTLRLHIKQYVPKEPAPSNAGASAVTIIGAHANGFPKEMYEPFWDDLYDHMRAQGRNIRGVWIADIASQGQSGILNESVLGPERMNHISNYYWSFG
jgi:hypothetical protein